MAVVHSYYRILGIAGNADLHMISRAISDLRQRDLDGNYSATLNTIEKVLTDPDQRRQYDDSIGLSPEERADYQAQKKNVLQSQTQKKTTAVPAANNIPFLDISEKDMQLQQAQAKFDSVNTEQSYEDVELKYPKSFPLKQILLFILLGGLIIAGVMFSKPLYVEYQTHKQAEAALDDLFAARDSVMQYIRTNKLFPQNSIPNFVPAADFYDIRLMPDQRIQLIFNGTAMKRLRGGSYSLKPYEIPNAGLDWQCTTDTLFPVEYKPARCF